MIVDNIKNAPHYFCLGDGFKRALEYMADNMETISESVVLDETVKINYASYNTKNKEDCFFEAHKEYADIHLILKGSESIGYALTEELEVTDEKPENDCVFLAGNGTDIPMMPGTFMILFPQDAHMVGMRSGKSYECTKLVAKIKLGI